MQIEVIIVKIFYNTELLRKQLCGCSTFTKTSPFGETSESTRFQEVSIELFFVKLELRLGPWARERSIRVLELPASYTSADSISLCCLQFRGFPFAAHVF